MPHFYFTDTLNLGSIHHFDSTQFYILGHKCSICGGLSLGNDVHSIKLSLMLCILETYHNISLRANFSIINQANERNNIIACHTISPRHIGQSSHLSGNTNHDILSSIEVLITTDMYEQYIVNQKLKIKANLNFDEFALSTECKPSFQIDITRSATPVARSGSPHDLMPADIDGSLNLEDLLVIFN